MLYYNKLLKEQVQELDQTLFNEQQDLVAFTGRSFFYIRTASGIDYDYQQQKQQLEGKTKQLAAEVLAFEHDPAALKSWLKLYRLPKNVPIRLSF